MMLKERIFQDRIKALKQKESGKVAKTVLISLLSTITQFEKDRSSELVDGVITDNQVLKIVEKAIKQRTESATMFRNGGRDELADKEEMEISILKEYMPEVMSKEEMLIVINEAILLVGATSMKQMGSVIEKCRSKLQGKADMGKVSSIVKSILS